MPLSWVLMLIAVLQSDVTSVYASHSNEEFRRLVLSELQALKSKHDILEANLTEALVENAEQVDSSTFQIKDSKRLFADTLSPVTQVGFSAQVLHHVNSLSANQRIVFGYAQSNFGGHYNTATGVFQVPVAGTYLFYVNILSGESGFIETELVVDGRHLAGIYSGSRGFFGAGSNLVIAHLEPGTSV